MKSGYVFCFLLISFVTSKCYAQRVKSESLNRIEINVDPFFLDHPKGLGKEDLDSSAIKIIIYESYLVHFSMDRFYEMLKSLNKSNEAKIDQNGVDYRVECTLFFVSGRKEYFLMDPHGVFFYNNKGYYKTEIKKFVFDHIPTLYKDGRE